MQYCSRTIYGVLIATSVASPVRAANPPVTLALEEVTCRQAVDAISKATGLPIELREPNVPPGTPLPPQYARLQQRRNFTWRGVRLAEVLRQLSTEYGVRVNRYSNVFSVSPENGPPAAAVPPKLFVDKQGVRIYPTYVSVSSNRTQNLENGDAAEINSNVGLRLKVSWPGGEPDSILGFDNVVARDDQGNVLLWNAPAITTRRPTVGSGLPDEWDSTISLQDPHPRATKLQWLEGDLMVYGVFKPVTLEIPFSGKERTGTRRTGEAEATITSFEQRTGTPGNPAGGVVVKARVLLPQGERFLSPAFGYSPSPILVGASGKQYFSRGGRRSSSTRNSIAEHDVEAEFAPIEEPLVKAVFSLVERGEPKKLFSFRLNDLSFPPEAAFVPRTQPRPSRPAPGVTNAETPFHQPGGGTLTFRTEISGSPVADGTVTVGLAQKQGSDWGPIRWRDLPVDRNGVVRLPELTPGAYRLIRVYRAGTNRRLGAEGQWQNGEVQITLVAKQSTTAAPLQWITKSGTAVPAKR